MSILAIILFKYYLLVIYISQGGANGPVGAKKISGGSLLPAPIYDWPNLAQNCKRQHTST